MSEEYKPRYDPATVCQDHLSVIVKTLDNDYIRIRDITSQIWAARCKRLYNEMQFLAIIVNRHVKQDIVNRHVKQDIVSRRAQQKLFVRRVAEGYGGDVQSYAKLVLEGKAPTRDPYAHGLELSHTQGSEHGK